MGSSSSSGNATADSGLKTIRLPRWSIALLSTSDTKETNPSLTCHIFRLRHTNSRLSLPKRRSSSRHCFSTAIYTAHASSAQTASNTLRLFASSPVRDQDMPLRQSLFWVRRRRTNLFVGCADEERRTGAANGKEGFTHSTRASAGAISLRPANLRP